MQLRNMQRGMGLVEMILGIVVAVGVLLMITRMQVSASNDMRAKTTAEQMQSLNVIALQYLQSNYSAIFAAAKDNTTPEVYCVVGANATTGAGGTTANNTALKTCAVDMAWLKYKKFAPIDLKETNAYNQKLYIVYRIVDVTTGDMEMLLVGGTNGGSEVAGTATDLGIAAELMGGNGGFIPAADWGVCKYITAGVKQACGTGGGWKVDLSLYIAAPVTVKPGSVASYNYVPKAAITASVSGGTSTLPVKAVGDACTAGDANTVAITSDQSSLLTCQSGQWKGQQASSNLPCVMNSSIVAHNTWVGYTNDYFRWDTQVGVEMNDFYRNVQVKKCNNGVIENTGRAEHSSYWNGSNWVFKLGKCNYTSTTGTVPPCVP